MGAVRTHISVGGGYDVLTGPGLLCRAGELIREAVGDCALAVVTDSTVDALYGSAVMDSLGAAGYRAAKLAFPAGERHKNMRTLTDVLEFLAESGLTRKDCVVALGGGVAGDMAGFASACYMRGVRFVQLPTTLLAAVDASVGGKTAVDLRGGKNLAGAFHQPSLVVCDTDTFATLPPEAVADGAAEIVKTGILSGEALFSKVEGGISPEALPEIVAACVAHKGMVVEEDELDTGLRQTLNLGHTFGHAIEKLSDYGISHGHAVAMGTAVIARAAARLWGADKALAERIVNALSANGLPTAPPYAPRELAKAALSDKKRAGGSITMAVPMGIGDCRLMTLPVDALEAAAEAGAEAL